MSGHSKWATTKHHKAIVDGKKGKTLTKHSKLITVAARLGGGDPATNASLAVAIALAKKDSVPNANIDRAVKLGTGELKDGSEVSEVLYEGFAPHNVALIIKGITDNRNRTVAEFRHLLSQNGGSLGEVGSVGWMFVRKGVIVLKPSTNLDEDMQLELIDQGADDVDIFEEGIEITCEVEKLASLQNFLKSKGFTVESAEISYIATNKTEITNEEEQNRVLAVIEKLEEHDDVSEVWSTLVIGQ